MPASSSAPSCLEETRARWRKRKREQRAARKSKLKEVENNEDTFEEDNEEDEDQDLDPPQNHIKIGYDPHNGNANQVLRKNENETFADGGLRISEFPIAIKRVVSRPHSSVLGIVEAEKASRNGETGPTGVAVLENISYGQLQALSAVPRDSHALLRASMEETENEGSVVIMPPRIIAGSGVPKRLGSAGRVHVVPVHSEWFSLNSVHRLERQVVPHFFSRKSTEHTPEKYIENRNLIVAKYMENPDKHLSASDCQGLVTGIDIDGLTRIVRFLDHWGIINYCAIPPKLETRKNETYLCEDSNGELRVPFDVLKSIDSLIQFDKPKCRLKVTDAYPELACRHEEDSDFDISIREQLSENQCYYCSRRIPTVYYQSQKEADVLLCLDCFNEGRFVAGHSSLDFLKVNSTKDYGDVYTDTWSDQETLLLLEGMQLYNENWNKIVEHVGTKSKAQCILHFVCLPLDGTQLENIDVPSTSGSSNLWSHDSYEKPESSSNGFDVQGGDSESKFPFVNSENPVMNLVAFLASTLGPRVAAACAHASLASLCKDEKVKDSVITLDAEKVKDAAEDGLAAAAVKAKLFADHEEREIQRLSANIVNHQLKRLELKLKQFAEIETLLMRECEQMERTRQRIRSERALMTSAQFVSTGLSRPIGPPSIGPLTTGNSRPQASSCSQNPPPSISGYGSSQQPVHPNMSYTHQQGIYGPGPGFPLSAMSTSISNFNPTSNSQSSLGHSMLRPLTGTKSGLG